MPTSAFLDAEMPSRRLCRSLAEVDAAAELAQRAVHHRDPVVTEVDHPDVTELRLRVAPGSRGTVAVDRVAVQVEGDVVGADHDAVVGAVDEVVVEGRVGGDRVAALGLLGGDRDVARTHEGNDHEGRDSRKPERSPEARVREKLDRHPFLPHLAAQAVSRIQANLHPALSERKAFLGVGRLHKAAGLRE